MATVCSETNIFYESSDKDSFHTLECGVRLKNSQVLAINLDAKLNHLAPEQQSDMSTLISEYSHLFSDVPGITDALFHDVDVGTARPIKQHAYRCWKMISLKRVIAHGAHLVF